MLRRGQEVRPEVVRVVLAARRVKVVPVVPLQVAVEDPAVAGGGMRRGGMSNLSQALENMPAINLNDIKKGDPVVIFSSEGTNPSEVTAIYILTGVEPILAALPKGGGEMNLGTWNLSLGGGGGGGEGGP